MHKTILLVTFTFTYYILTAQNAETIIAGFQSINNSVTTGACNTGKGNVISNRAMNVFLSNKIGYYLSDDDDLSLYKNTIRFNTNEGNFSITHNLRQAKGLDEPVKSFVNIGARANILNGLLSRVNNRHYVNDLGFLVKQNWIGKTKTYFNKCTTTPGTPTNQKVCMDVERASILQLIQMEIQQRDSLFKVGMKAIDTMPFPLQDANEAKSNLRKHFYSDLLDDCSRRFAELESDALIKTKHFSLITTNWTILSVYLPLMRQRFYVANSFTSNFEDKHLYPLELSLTHTRLWESSKSGRLLVRVNSKFFANNSYRNNELATVSSTEYKQSGGRDTMHLREQNSDQVFIGNYNNFITPQANVNVVYFPSNAHFGLSGYVEQNFGRYKAMNAKIGFPVVLIDKKGNPDINFEFQIRFFDINNKVQAAVKPADKTFIGFSVGVPFSRIVY